MSKQNIFIINFNSLYKILNEIKETLPFNITNYDDELDLIKTPILDIKNSLFISQFNLKFLTNIKLNQKNSLDFNNFPLSLNKLVELINIKLIKLKFSHQSKININEYDLNINSRVLSKEDLNLKLTEKEIEIILYLNASKAKHDVLDLQKNIWYYSFEIETHTVETHIYRLRKKISNKFNDEKFILSHQNGYFIE
tara:strand:+ start:821 stop:1408 length:588 start_codon:yes stop_codon:yes gene_type:complete